MTNTEAIEIFNTIISDLKWHNEWSDSKAEAIEIAIHSLSREPADENYNFD